MGKVLTLRAPAGSAMQAGATSLVDEAYQALKTAIRENVFPPGHQAAEPEIARQLGMSRTPVHEAIIRLQEEGLVQVLPRRGILICPISADDIREIYDVLIAIEGMATVLLAGLHAALAGSAAEALERETAGMEQALERGNLLGWATADERFHQLLTERCGNRRLARISATVRGQSHRARLFTLYLRPLPTASAAEHRRITDAIRAGKPAQAEVAARAHRSRARDALLPLLIQYGMRNL